MTVDGCRSRLYAGWLRWHHYAGLLFGVVTFTWTLSGMLSMDPFPQLDTGGATPVQRRAVQGPVESGHALDGAAVADAVREAGDALVPKEMTLSYVGGQPYWIAFETAGRTALVPASRPTDGALAQFPRHQIETLGRAAAPAPLADVVWLDDDDGYFTTRATPRSLPVLRVRSNDGDGTWLYLDPRTGGIALVLRRPDRANRWLYNGLHSLDPTLASSPPAVVGHHRDRAEPRRTGIGPHQRDAGMAAGATVVAARTAPTLTALIGSPGPSTTCAHQPYDNDTSPLTPGLE